MNRSGQAMIEALIAGLLCFLSLWYLLILGLKIVQSTHQADIDEEHAILSQSF